MKLIVLGGAGYLGSKAVSFARQLGLEVEVASRRSACAVDFTKPVTFERLRGADVVLDVADSTSTSPEAIARFCVENGLTFLEASSDTSVVERLHVAAREWKGPGRLVLGAGIFTGLSNLLARHVVNAAGAATHVTLGISSSPFSASGRGTVALMAKASGSVVTRYENAQRHDTAGASGGPALDFGGVRYSTLRASFPEPYMLRESLGVANVDVFFAPRPALLVPAFRLVPAWLATSAPFAWVMRGYFTVLRRLLLRWRTSPVRLVATASSPHGTQTRCLVTEDGMEAAGAAMACMAKLLATTPKAGAVSFVDQLLALDDVLALLETVRAGLVRRVPS